MTSAQKGEGPKYAPNLLTNSIDFADREGGGGQTSLDVIMEGPLYEILLFKASCGRNIG